MLNEHIKGLSILSVLLVIVGLFLMFLSISFGTNLGVFWLSNLENGTFDTNQYITICINIFVIIGSILFSAGLFIAILTYFTCVLVGKKESIQQTDS